MFKDKITALYFRPSQDDGLEESNSITNQDKTKYSMYSTFIGAGVNLAVCCIFMPIVAKFISMESVVYVSIIAFWLSYTAIFIARVLLSKKLVNIRTNWFKFFAQYLLLLALAVVYTFNIKFKWIIALAVILLIFVINLKEIIFVVKKFLSLFKKKQKQVATDTTNSVETMTDQDSDNVEENVQDKENNEGE